ADSVNGGCDTAASASRQHRRNRLATDVPLSAQEENMRSTRYLVRCIFIMAVCFLSSAWSHAQDYPSRPIRIIVADSPGASWDLVARLIGPEMSKLLGQAMVIENKPGASYAIGLGYVAKQVPADGY